MTPLLSIFNSYTGMSPAEKSMVVNFISEHTENAQQHDIREAVEYAIKLKPSFGGFILTAQLNQKIIAAIVVNRTGMDGYNPDNLFVYVSMHKKFRNKPQLIRLLMEKAIDYADGDIALHVEPNNPALSLYQKIGFQAQYLELRFSKNQHSTAVA